MKKFFRYLLLIFLFFSVQTVFSQEKKEGGEKDNKTSMKSERAKRRADKRKWKEARRAKRADEKKVKAHHKRIQTKDVQKRMKKSKKKSQRLKENKREFFLKRWFRKK